MPHPTPPPAVLLAAVFMTLGPVHARADGITFVDGKPSGEKTLKLALEPSQLSRVEAMRRALEASKAPDFESDEYVPVSLQLALSSAQQAEVERGAGKRVTWIEAGLRERFDGECTCDVKNLAFADGTDVLVFTRTLDPYELSDDEAKAHLAAGSYAPSRKVDNLGTDSCELPDGTFALKSPADATAVPKLALDPVARRALSKLLDGLDLHVDAPLPERGFKRARIAFPALAEDAPDNGMLSWAHHLGPEGTHLSETSTQGLEARLKRSGDLRLVVFKDAWIGPAGTLHRVARALVFRGEALLLMLDHDHGVLGCRHP